MRRRATWAGDGSAELPVVGTEGDIAALNGGVPESRENCRPSRVTKLREIYAQVKFLEFGRPVKSGAPGVRGGGARAQAAARPDL